MMSRVLLCLMLLFALPSFAAERLSARGVFHALIDGALLLAVPAAQEDVPFARPVSVIEEVGDNTWFDGNYYVLYVLGPSAQDVVVLEKQLGKPIELDLDRDEAGVLRVAFARFP